MDFNLNTQTRTRSFEKNLLFSFLPLLNIFAGMFSRNLFLENIGSSSLGTGGLFGNVFVIFSLLEFGVFPSCVYLLYSPVLKKDGAEILQIVSFAKKHFRRVFYISLTLSVLFLPYVHKIVDVYIPNLELVFFLLSLSAFSPFLFMHTRLLLFADRREYIVSTYKTAFGLFECALECVVLIVTKSYPAYLSVHFLAGLAEDIFISNLAKKRYPFLKGAKSYNKTTSRKILAYAKTLFPHRLCGTALRSFDNIIVSFLFGVAKNADYSNFCMMQGVFSYFSSCIFDSIGANVGNLLAQKDENAAKDVFDAVFFLNFCVTSICCVCLFCAGGDFLSVFIPRANKPDILLLIFICICFFSSGIRMSVLVFRENYGLFRKEKIKPYLDTALTVLFSVLFSKKAGIGGIFLAYGCVGLFFSAPVEAHTLFKYGFRAPVLHYLRSLFLYFVFCTCSCIFCSALCKSLLCEGYVRFILKIVICAFFTLAGILLVFGKSRAYKLLLKKVCGKKH